MNTDRRNAEWYDDPTAFSALENIESRERAKKLMDEIIFLIQANDFELVERIQLYDRRTGRVYK